MRKADGTLGNGAKNSTFTTFSILNDPLHTQPYAHLYYQQTTRDRAAVHTRTHTLPHGGQYDLVEQVVVELLGHFEAGPLHSHRGGQTQDNAQAAQHAEHRQVPGVTEDTTLQRRIRLFNTRLQPLV